MPTVAARGVGRGCGVRVFVVLDSPSETGSSEKESVR